MTLFSFFIEIFLELTRAQKEMRAKRKLTGQVSLRQVRPKIDPEQQTRDNLECRFFAPQNIFPLLNQVDPSLDIEEEAIWLLFHESQQHVIHLFEMANLLAIRSKRVILLPGDLVWAQRFIGHINGEQDRIENQACFKEIFIMLDTLPIEVRYIVLEYTHSSALGEHARSNKHSLYHDHPCIELCEKYLLHLLSSSFDRKHCELSWSGRRRCRWSQLPHRQEENSMVTFKTWMLLNTRVSRLSSSL